MGERYEKLENGGRGKNPQLFQHSGILFPITHMPASLYETSDVYLASFLLCQGATLHSYEHASPRRVVFRFATDEHFHALLRLYWSNAPVTIVPLALFTSLRRLKSLSRRRLAGQPSPTTPATLVSAAPVQPC